MNKAGEGLSSFQLKWIAIITMVIDHTGLVLFPQYRVLRLIGRVSFPIFCFLLVEGFHHTHDRKKYFIRLGLFALLSEIPFNVVLFGTCFAPWYQNVFWTLAIGVLMMSALNRIREKNIGAGAGFETAFVVIAAMMLATILQTDYAEKGLFIIFLFYIFYEKRIVGALSVAGFNLLLGLWSPGSLQWAAALSLLPIMCYNGREGRKMKYFFYVFYPAHLLLLYVISKVW